VSTLRLLRGVPIGFQRQGFSRLQEHTNELLQDASEQLKEKQPKRKQLAQSMELSRLTTTVLPIAIVLMMMGIGLGLNLNAFKQVLQSPSALVCGLIAQLVMLPVVGFGVAALFPLAPELAVGVVIVGACPGGATSNMVTYLVRGNLALSVALTVLSTMVTVVTIPFVVNFGVQQFMSEAVVLQLPILKTMVQLATLKILPLDTGMVMQGYWPKWAAKAEKWVIKGCICRAGGRGALHCGANVG
jgi:BASS family bile acid:Na+ symporter